MRLGVLARFGHVAFSGVGFENCKQSSTSTRVLSKIVTE